MKQSSWGCTIFIQLSLCLVVYVSLHLGHPFFFSTNDTDNATPLDLHFFSVAGGFRPFHSQTRLLRLMERVAETYKATFVLSTSEYGEKDPLLQNATRVSSSLKLPWYTRKKGSGYFRERIKLPFGGSLDVVFVDTSSLQQEVLGGASNAYMMSQLKGLTRILKAADGDWRIVVGSEPLLAYNLTKKPEEAKGVASTFDQIMTKYGVNLYVSEKGCTNGASSESFTCITVPNQSENRGSTNDSKREMEDGFLLHRVSFSEFVTYTINLSGQVIDTRLAKQKESKFWLPPFENDDDLGYLESCLEEYGVKSRPHWITTEFGGQRIEMVLKRFGSNIIFPNGMQDPWSRAEEGAHHTDLRAATKDDPMWLKEQRRQEVSEIEKWISEYCSSDLRQEEQDK